MTYKALAVYTILAGAVLSAQVVHNPATALKNWPAPLHWQPSPTGSDAGTSLIRANVRTPDDSAVPSFLIFVAMTPCRVVDTRTSSGFPSPLGTPSLSAGTVRSFPIQSSTMCSIPANAQAYSFNVTVVPPGPVGYLILWPEGQSQPNAVTLDDITGDIRNNAAIVPAGTPSGGISAVVNATTDLVIDINGYYAVPSDSGENTILGAGNPLNNTGAANTAVGSYTFFDNTTGHQNTAVGALALNENTTGYNNTATGYAALANMSTGEGNTVSGSSQEMTSFVGTGNIMIGLQYGDGFYNGGGNIDIGNSGVATDGGVIRIGTSVHTAFFAGGIAGVPVSNQAEVMINTASGQLGTVGSSLRYKEDIQDMRDASSGLLGLRPVTFRYRQPYPDGSQPIDYGLIAEEVADVYPGLVSKRADGQIETVQYHKLVPMLLNELQKEYTEVEREHATVGSLHQTVDTLQAQVAALQKTLEALLAGKAQ